MAVTSDDKGWLYVMALACFVSVTVGFASSELGFTHKLNTITFPTHNESATYTLTKDELELVKAYKIKLVKERVE